jgi:hypothetical protein
VLKLIYSHVQIEKFSPENPLHWEIGTGEKWWKKEEGMGVEGLVGKDEEMWRGRGKTKKVVERK